MTDKKSDNAGRAADQVCLEDIVAAKRMLEENGLEPYVLPMFWSVPNEAEWLTKVAGVSPDRVVVLRKIPVND